MLINSRLSPHKPIEQRPSKHKATEPSQQLIPTHPKLPNWVLKVQSLPARTLSILFRPLWPLPTKTQPLRTQQPHKERNEKRAEEIEYEARVGFQAEDAGSDAEEGGGEGAHCC